MHTRLWLMAIFILIFQAGAQSAPLEGEWMDFEQPDRSPVKLRVFGDEFYARFEGADGFSVVKDPANGWFCYGELSADGEDLVSTGIPYPHSGQPGARALGLQRGRSLRFPTERGLKLKPERRRRIAEGNRAKLQAAEEEGGNGAAPAPAPSEIEPAPLSGGVLGLTLLIQFPDVPGSIPQATVEAFCNQPGWSEWGNNGSVRDYWHESSGGALEYTNHVTAYYTARQPRAYYTDPAVGYGTRARELIHEALAWLDAQGFDFATLGTDGSRRIRAINAFYAGPTVNNWSEGLWPHKSTLSPVFSADGVSSGGYQISNMGSSLSLGTFCHENGHLLMGWPDLYDYDSDSRGVGNYCIMASSGSTNPRPPHAWLRHDGGWAQAADISAAAPGTLFTVSANAVGMLRYRNPANAAESFYIEALRKTGRRATIPGEGLAVWHVDTAGNNSYQEMTAARHYKSSLEQADGRFDLEHNANSGDATDLYRQGGATQLSDASLPDAKWWSGAPSGLSITDVSAAGDVMTFRIGVPSSASPTRTPLPPLPTFTRTPAPPASTFTRTAQPPAPTFTRTATHTPQPPASTFTHTATHTPQPPASTFTQTATQSPQPPASTFTRTASPTLQPPASTFTHTATPTPQPPTPTFSSVPTPEAPSATATDIPGAPSATASPTAQPPSPSFTFSATPSPVLSATPHRVPGRIQAEDFSAYFDATPGNQGGLYRSTDVDLEACADLGGGFHVGQTANGEWLDFDIQAASTGTYTLRLRMASAETAAMYLHLMLDGARLTPTYRVPPTGGWQAWVTYYVNISLPAGRHVLQTFFDRGGYNLNYIDLVFLPSAAPSGGEAAPLETEDVPLDKPGQPRGGGAPLGKLLIAGPNPAGDEAVILFQLPQPSRARLLVSDLSGGLAIRDELGWLEAGAHRRTLKLKQLAPGLLVVTLQCDTGSGWKNQAAFKLVVKR